MKAYVGIDVLIHVFLSSALVAVGQLHVPAALLPSGRVPIPVDKRPGGLQSCLDNVEKLKFLTLPGLEL
jgi:hypothetical protein